MPAAVRCTCGQLERLAIYYRRGLSTSARSLSHVGSAPVDMPSSVSLQEVGGGTLDGYDRQWTVKGPKGTLSFPVRRHVSLSFDKDKRANVSVDDPLSKQQRSLWGLYRSLLANAVTGVSKGHSLQLRLVGVGYRASLESDPGSPSQKRLNLKLGYSHPITVSIPSAVHVETPQPNVIVLAGPDKQQLGQLAATIRAYRRPEPYNGKGIFVGDETIKRKEVKKK